MNKGVRYVLKSQQRKVIPPNDKIPISYMIWKMNNEDKKQNRIVSNFKLEDNNKKLPPNYNFMEYRTLIDFSYVPRFIQDKIFESGYFPLNKTLSIPPVINFPSHVKVDPGPISIFMFVLVGFLYLSGK